MNKSKLTQEMEILSREIQREEAKYANAAQTGDTLTERNEISMRIKQLQEQFDELSEELEELQENEPTSGGE